MSIGANNDFVQSPLDLLNASVSVTGATVVSTTFAAPANSLNRNCVTRLTITVGASGAQAPLFVGIFDGASTSSTVLGLWCVMPTLTAASTGSPSPPIDLQNLQILGTANKATCVGTTAAPAASTSMALTAQGYVFGRQPQVVTFNS